MRISLDIRRSVGIIRTPRVRQAEGLFDVPPGTDAERVWRHRLDLPAEWHVGVVVGSSGSGKTTFAREAFGPHVGVPWDWPDDKSVLDGFPADLGIREITGLLCSVGFSSPPAWLRPFRVLSTGEQFRVNLARTLAERRDVAVADEFTSVVDRTVARVGSAAVAKAVRRSGRKFVAVTCHYDVLDWLEPDWVYEPHSGEFHLNAAPGAQARSQPIAERPTDAERRTDTDVGARSASAPRRPCEANGASETNPASNAISVHSGSRGFLWRRPPIELVVRRVRAAAWKLFEPHHYLSDTLHPSAQCFIAFVALGGGSTEETGEAEGQPAAFVAALPFPHARRSGWREHRCVCLPDFQGVGIGNALSEFVAGLYAATGRPYTSTTSHPAMLRHRARSPLWRMTRGPSMKSRHRGLGHVSANSVGRLTAAFEYVGPRRAAEAIQFGLRVIAASRQHATFHAGR